MRIQYFSDVHLEFHAVLPVVKPIASVACLAGDIGYPFSGLYENFLIYINSLFEKVFIISGNHEYYAINDNTGCTMDAIDRQIEMIIIKNNLTRVTYLNNKYEDWNGVRFIGTTLWSYVYDKDYLINDYNCIIGFDVNKNNYLFNKNINYLNMEILKSEYPMVVMTHHLPSFQLIDKKFETSKYNQCFAANCEFLLREPVLAWVYGHTHIPNKCKFNNIDLLCNPIGYPSENKIMNFEKYFDI